MEITFLGSGSALPTKERMLSSMVLNREGENFLFDCGESTQFQMISLEIKSFKINNVFITHLHGDHIFGLPGLLSTMNLQRRTEPITTFGPTGIKSFLETSFNISNLKSKFEINITEFDSDYEGGIILETDEYIVTAKPLEHSMFNLGYRFQEKDRAGNLDVEKANLLGLPMGPMIGELKKGNSIQLNNKTIYPDDVLGERKKGKSVCYATDTKYSLNTIELAKDVDVLIHEATFEASFGEKAAELLHSTTLDAANIAAKSNAKLLIITHISSRNEDVEKLLSECKTIFPNTIAAYDSLRVVV